MKKRMYYVTGNTGDGFVNLIYSNVTYLKHIYVLKAASERVNTILFKSLAEAFEANSFPIELLCSAKGKDYLDGIIIREKSIAFLTEEVAAPLKHKQSIDLSHLRPFNQTVKQEIGLIRQAYQAHMEEAYKHFQTGLRIHDDLENTFIQEMDFTLADELTNQFLTRLLENQTPRNRKAHTYHRLFGTNTPAGSVNLVPHLLERVQKSFFMKGRAGTGKSTFMKRVAAACQDYGLDVEQYHCSFDPKSIDMVLVPELDFCIFDSTEPHAFYPNREGQEIIDMYEQTVTPGTDEKYATEIQTITTGYKDHMKAGKLALEKAGSLLDEIEPYDDYALEQIKNEAQKLFNHVEKL